MKKVRVFRNLDTLSKGCAEFIFREIKKSMHNTGKADIVLSGGKTPEICYQNLASLLNRESALVNQINWFIGDERWVPSDNEQSNNRLIHKNLLNTINAPDDRVYT